MFARTQARSLGTLTTINVRTSQVSKRFIATTLSKSQISPPPPPATSGTNVGRTTRVQNKDLPSVPNSLPYLTAFIVVAIASWGGFTVYATNKEKLSSSIFKSVVSQVKNSSEVAQLLSPSSSSSTSNSKPSSTLSSIILKRETWLGGMPRVKGSVNMMQGRIDLSFKINLTPEPETGERVGTVYFTSIRANKHAPFEILRFLVVNDETGETISLLDQTKLSTIDVDSGDII